MARGLAVSDIGFEGFEANGFEAGEFATEGFELAASGAGSGKSPVGWTERAGSLGLLVATWVAAAGAPVARPVLLPAVTPVGFGGSAGFEALGAEAKLCRRRL